MNWGITTKQIQSYFAGVQQNKVVTMLWKRSDWCPQPGIQGCWLCFCTQLKVESSGENQPLLCLKNRGLEPLQQQMKSCFQIQFFCHKREKKNLRISVSWKNKTNFSVWKFKTQGLYDGLDDNRFDYIAYSQLLIKKVFFSFTLYFSFTLLLYLISLSLFMQRIIKIYSFKRTSKSTLRGGPPPLLEITLTFHLQCVHGIDGNHGSHFEWLLQVQPTELFIHPLLRDPVEPTFFLKWLLNSSSLKRTCDVA